MLRSRGRGRGGSGGAVAPFTPASISGLLLWHDASDTASITHSSGSVSQINDLSVNAYHSTQPTGADQPVTNSRTVNSLNVLDLNGSTQWLEMNATLRGILNSTDFDMFVVAATDSTTTFQHIIGGRDNGVLDVRFGVMAAYNSNTAQAMCNPTYIPSSKTVTKDTNAHVYGGTRTGAVINSIFDGGSLGANAAAANVNMNILIIGQTGINTAYWDGVFCEMVVCPVQTSTVRNQLGNYFAAKWGLTWSAM